MKPERLERIREALASNCYRFNECEVMEELLAEVDRLRAGVEAVQRLPRHTYENRYMGTVECVCRADVLAAMGGNATK